MKKIISVIGPSEPSPKEYEMAFKIGEYLAKNGFIVATGGKGGIMEAALKGANKGGGLTLGILPEQNLSFANPYVDIPITTGIGEIRNFVLVNTGIVTVSIGISEGTLIEISYALKMGKTLFSYNLPEIPHVFQDGRIIRFSNINEFDEEFRNFMEV